MNDIITNRIIRKADRLKQLTAEVRRKKSKFLDFIENHTLPMVLADSDGNVLYANEAMNSLVGHKGKNAEEYYSNPDELTTAKAILEKNGRISGLKVTIKDANNQPKVMRLYSNVNRDEQGNWLNTRCVLVPNGD